MLTVESPDIIQVVAARSRITVHKTKRMLRWGAPCLEDLVVAWWAERGHNDDEVRQWYRQQREKYITRHKMTREVERQIVRKQHRAKIHSLLSG